MVPPDDILGLLPTWLGVYILSGFAFSFAGLIFYRRAVRLIMLGKPVDRFDHPLRRILGAIPQTFGQRKVLQSVSLTDWAGLAHLFIFWGFLSFIGSYAVFIYGDSIWNQFSVNLFTATGVRVFTAYVDLIAGIFLLVLVWAVVRRWVATPHRLSFDLTRSLDSIAVVVLTASLMVLTLLTEAFYVASGGEGPHSYAPIGSAIGQYILSLGVAQDIAGALWEAFWWLHLIVILGFGIFIPLSKHTHLLGSPMSFVFRTLGPMGTLSTPKDLETAETFGAGKVQDFTWKELLDGYACAVCGRCTDNCPAHISGKILSPMHVVENLKEHLLESGPDILKSSDGSESKSLIGNKVQEEELWDCLTCGACEQECPVGVEHIDTIVDMRRNLVMEQGRMPETAQAALLSMEQRGHPWRGTTHSRNDWAEGLDVKRLVDFPDTEILLWIGCTVALEKRSQNVARSMVSVLKRAEVDFAILGIEETCTGDPARRMGNEYLYQTLARQNIKTLTSYAVKKIVTICPHCFNTIKNEYPHLGGAYDVVHYSEFIAELIKDGKIKPVVKIEANVAYHDSCYLGRHNDIYDSPRQIAKAIPGLNLVELRLRRERSFCCGAGGGHMWMEEKKGRRVNHIRTDQFLETGADTVGVSCPFCLQMFTEAIGAKGLQAEKQAKDIIEILDDSLGLIEGPE